MQWWYYDYIQNDSAGLYCKKIFQILSILRRLTTVDFLSKCCIFFVIEWKLKQNGEDTLNKKGISWMFYERYSTMEMPKSNYFLKTASAISHKNIMWNLDLPVFFSQ